MASLKEMSLPVQLLIAVVVAALVLGVGYYFGIQAKMNDNQIAKQKLDLQLEENNNLRKFETDLPKLEAEIALLNQQMEIARKIVPDAKEADQFMHLVQETAQAAGIEVRRYTSKPVVSHEYYTELPFEIEIDGPYYSLLNFFERLGNLERIINVSTLKLANPREGSAAGAKKRYAYPPSATVVATATATTFFSHEPPPPPPAPVGKGAKGGPAKGGKPAAPAKK